MTVTVKIECPFCHKEFVGHGSDEEDAKTFAQEQLDMHLEEDSCN